MRANILIVDDDPNLSRLMAGLLQGREYRVIVASTGADALAKIRHRPDLVLLDLSLPDMEGLDICRKIREDKRLRHIPIMIVSGRDTLTERIEGLYVGADDYITKPYDNEELIARVEALLRRSRFNDYLVKEKDNLIREVKRIIKESDIKTFFQPIFDLQSKKPLGYEVLSRPPTIGPVSNPEFLFRAALTYGMYYELEMLCWEKAFVLWNDLSRPGCLFLNCMPYLIEHEKFTAQVLEEHKIPGRQIVLEMTERMAINDFVLFHSKVHDLKKTGLHIAIDDVGNGYASLDTIAETEPDYVKIDMFLVRNIQDSLLKQSIVESIVSFCRKNGIVTVAEGVEKKTELEMIRQLGVGAVQGYLLAKPALNIPNQLSWDQ